MTNQIEEPRDGSVEKLEHTDERDQISNEVTTDLQRIGSAGHQCIDDIVLFTSRETKHA